MKTSHFVTDNDSRETQETWDACHSEGVRALEVTKEIPPAVQGLDDQSLIQGRDVLSQMSEADKKKWLAKDGQDWSGAFGQDPAQYAWENKDGRKRTLGNEDGSDEDISDSEDGDDTPSSSEESDLGLHDAENYDAFDDDQGNDEGDDG